jgi:aminoglycoside phosphotransferase family enzyme
VTGAACVARRIVEAPARAKHQRAGGHVTAESPIPDTTVPLAAKVAFLSDRRAYPGLESPVITRETHMSWVFLAGDRAYKLKKPVRFPYLDFSTLSRREAACRAELRLNRRLAPDVYLGVVPLTLGAGELAIGGQGAVVDWLVAMRRLREAEALETRLNNHVRDAELDRLADTLARFYRRAGPVRISPQASLAEWSKALAYDRRVLLDSRFDLPRGLVRWIDRVLRRFLAAERPRLAAQARRRRILDAHGDLRPEHIWVTDPIRIVDCLEFSPSLRANDPLDEIAFLDLECERLGAPEAGRRIRARMLGALKQPDAEALYRFYRCHRAMLRARLAVAHLLEPEPRTPEKWPRLARTYLELARRDALRIERRLRPPSGRSGLGGGAAG